jgi:hypothetical protein
MEQVQTKASASAQVQKSAQQEPAPKKKSRRQRQRENRKKRAEAETEAHTQIKTEGKTKEEIVKEKRALEPPSPIKADDRTCFACKKVCESRNQLNHHYGGCPSFLEKFRTLKTPDRHWHMIIQYALNKPKITGRICIGCGEIQTSRDALHQHFTKCQKAMDIDQWDRISMFGLLEGTEHDDSAIHMKKYVPRQVVPDHVKRMFRFVTSLKEDVERKKKDELEKKMKTCTCVHCAYAQHEPAIPHATLSQAQKEGYLVVPVMMAGYGTVLNGRMVYVPQQQVYVRIHDKGPVSAPVQVQVQASEPGPHNSRTSS